MGVRSPCGTSRLEDAGPHTCTNPLGCTHPAPRLRVLPSTPPGLAAPAVPVSQRARSWGRRGHVRCRDKPAASPPLAPTPGAGAAQLQAETCLANYREGEDFRGFAFLSGHTWETTFTINQFLRNDFPPAWPCPGSPAGSGAGGAPVSPISGLSWVLQTPPSPLLLPPEPPQAPGRAGAFIHCAGAVQHSAPMGPSASRGSVHACPRGQSLWVSVTGSWGVCTGVPKRLEPHWWPARPFTFASAGDKAG